MRQAKKGFTLAELIIVITILAVLATIAFVSYNNYVSVARDSSRVSTLRGIQSGLWTFVVKTGAYPTTNKAISLYTSGVIYGQQGYFENSNATMIGMSPDILDPLDKTNYTYNVNINRTRYELLGYFENGTTATENNTLGRVPRVFGDDMWILLFNTGSDKNLPLQEKYDVASFTGVDTTFFTGTLSNGENIGELRIALTDADSLQWTGMTLPSLAFSYKWTVEIGLLLPGSGSGSCPAQWTDSGVFPVIIQWARTCEAPINTLLPAGTMIPMLAGSGTLQCPTGWTDTSASPGFYFFFTPTGSTAPLLCANTSAAALSELPSGTLMAMAACPIASWIDRGKLAKGGAKPAPVRIGTSSPLSGRVCEKK